MGYEVDVNGKITFFDIKGFKRDFPYKENRNSEVGMHNDFNYFFTKVWGNDLNELNTSNKEEIYFERNGKNWYNLDKAIKFLSKYADAYLEFQGENDDDAYKYIIYNKEITKYVKECSYKKEMI